MPDKSLSNTLNDTAKEYEKLLNTDNGVSQILENADKKAERNFRSDIKKAEQTAKNIAKKAKAEYSAYSGKTNTQTADSIALNAYQKRLYEVENDLQNNIDKSLLAYQALKANGQLSAAELEKENIQNLVQLKKNATDSIIRNANTVYEAKDSERALAYKKERDAIEDKRRQEQLTNLSDQSDADFTSAVMTGYMSAPEAQALQVNTDTVSNPYGRYMREVDTSAGNAYSRMLPQNGSPDTGTALYTLPEAGSGSDLSPLYPGEITGNGVTPAGGEIRVSDDNTGVNKNTRAGRNIAYDSPEELLSKIGRELQGAPTTEKINGKSLVYNKVDITPESGPVYELSIAISDYARSKGRNVVFYSGDVVYDNNIIEASGFETGDGILYVNISKPGSVYWYFGYEYGRDVLRSPDTDEATAFRDSVSGLVYGDDKKKFELDIEIDLSVNGDIRKELSEEEKRSVAENEVFADKFRIYLIRLLEDVNLEKLAAKAPGLLLRLSESLDSYITYLSGKIKNAEDPFYSEMREFINLSLIHI